MPANQPEPRSSKTENDAPDKASSEPQDHTPKTDNSSSDPKTYSVGVDIDPQAISASADNAARNGIAKERISLYLPPQMPKDLQADIVLANILAGPLVELAQPIMAMLKSGGQLVLSGLLVEQKENLIAAYTDIEFTQAHQQEQWLCLYGIKKQSVYD